MAYKEVTLNDLLESIEKTGKKYDIERIKKAYYFAEEAHEGQFRRSGERYISHPTAVAQILVGLGMDNDSIVVALLHDIVEDTKRTKEEVQSNFGLEIANMVDGLTKLEKIPHVTRLEAQAENIRKMLLAMSKDVRVIFIKLCDRLHNMRTLAAKPDPKRRATALETMYVYAPLAHRLGIQKIKQELENLGTL